jgi:hypothetical protein
MEGWCCPRPIHLVRAVMLLGMALLVLVWGSGGALRAEDKPARQSAKEADQAMKELMKKRSAIRGVTTRGQSVNEAPPFKVVPRKPALTKYPCTGCHDNSFVDARVRILKEEHSDLVFDHGGGRFWCYDACHNGRDMNDLVSLQRRPIDYDRAYRLCGQCHFEKRKDWAFGGHGRRAGAWPVPRDVPLTPDKLRVSEREKIGTWQGQRVLLSCPACHNPHSPSIKPFPLSPVPQVRAGLKRTETEPDNHLHAWERPMDAQGKRP